ncbi:MAG: hypothetical protein P8Z30_01195 [Acidobacteriota bacterium]
MMMASPESPLNFVHGPAKKPEWAQMVRLGGERVAVLFEELRRSVGKIDGIVEKLCYSGREGGWVVQYRVSGVELLTMRIAPGLLEVSIPLSPSEREILPGMRNLSGTIKDAIRGISNNEVESNSVRVPLTNRRRVHSVANLVMVKARLAQKLRK